MKTITDDWIYELYVKEIINHNNKPITKEEHIVRGSCCGNGCLYCPYTPKHQRGSTIIN